MKDNEKIDELFYSDTYYEEMIEEAKKDDFVSSDITHPITENELEGMNEGLVDVIFKNLRTNMKTVVAGPLIYFKWEWILSKTLFTIRVRRDTFNGFVEWINSIQKYVNEEPSK